MSPRCRSADLFPTDREVSPSRMIGRAAEVAELSRQLGNGINLVVAGPRRTGKTSACKAVLDQLRTTGAYVVEADLFGLTGAGALAEALVVSAVSNRSGLRRAVHSARAPGRSALRSTQLTVTTRAMRELGEDLEVALTPGLADRDPLRYLSYALTLCQRIAATDDRQVVLFIDELQEIAGAHRRFGDADTVTELMVATLERSERVTCLFAGSVAHLMRDMFGNQRRAFYKFGRMTSLGPIAEDDWRDGIQRLLAEDACTITEDAFSSVIGRCEGHPRATMLVMQQAHDAAVAEGVYEIDSALVDVGWGSALSADAHANAETVGHIKDLASNTLLVARAVAQGVSPYGLLRPQQARRALDALIGAGMMEERGRGVWKVTDPSLRDYLARGG